MCAFEVFTKPQNSQFRNNGIIATFVLPYNYSFLPYLHDIILVNVKLDVSILRELHFKVADPVGLVSF